MNVAVRFGENLSRARKRAGMSQEEAGIRASLHRTEIGLLERGERVPRIDTAIKLAGAVGECRWASWSRGSSGRRAWPAAATSRSNSRFRGGVRAAGARGGLRRAGVSG